MKIPNSIQEEIDRASTEYGINQYAVEHHRYGIDDFKAGAEHMYSIMNKKLTWIVRHAWICAAISKAKAAEILAVPLIDLDEALNENNK